MHSYGRFKQIGMHRCKLARLILQAERGDPATPSVNECLRTYELN